MDTFQVLVIIGLVAMGAITIVSLVWAFYLGAELRNRPAPKHYRVEIESPEVFSPEELVTISKEARESMRVVVDRAANELGQSLTATVASLTTKTADMANITLAQEFEKYQVSLAALRDETIKEFNELQGQLDKRREELAEKMEADVQHDRTERMDAFNARLGDVVSSYLVETLDKGVDLGAQAGYIVRMLEEHKEDIKKDVLS